ncbi:MAG: LacI family DNA-binding transcriptional regulator [Sedimentisphaerales bacterium]
MINAAEKPNRLVDIAQIAGVSRTAVAKVLFNSGGKHVRIAPETRERVRQIAKDLNYQPNVAARQLKGKRSQLIGVIIDSCAPSVSFSRLSKMEMEASRRGYRFMVGQSHDDIKHITAYARDFASYGVDGVICISHEYPEMGDQIAAMFSRFKNVVFVDKPMANSEHLSYVQIDYSEGVRLLVEYLASKSHKNIGTILGSLEIPNFKSQYDGYVKTLRMCGLDLQDELVAFFKFHEVLPPQEVLDACVAKMCSRSVDAILAMDDMWAIKIIKSLKKIGKRVPDDVAVVGFGNSEYATIYEPAITTVDEDLPELSKLVVEMLVNMIEGKSIPTEMRQICLSPKLIVRDSA